MRPSEALRQAQACVSEVEKDPGTGCWFFRTRGHGGRSCAGTDRDDIRRCRAREVLRLSLLRLGWPAELAGEFVATCHMRGPLISWIGVACAWKREHDAEVREATGHGA